MYFFFLLNIKKTFYYLLTTLFSTNFSKKTTTQDIDQTFLIYLQNVMPYAYVSELSYYAILVSLENM